MTTMTKEAPCTCMWIFLKTLFLCILASCLHVCMYVCIEATENWGFGNQIPIPFWERQTSLPQLAHGSCCLHVLHLHCGGLLVCLCVPSIARSNSIFTRQPSIISSLYPGAEAMKDVMHHNLLVDHSNKHCKH